MHYFTNDSSNKLVITLFTIFSLPGNFQIEDLIFKSANWEIRWFKEWQLCGWDSEQMKTNLRNPEHGFCPEWAQLTFSKNSLPKFGLYREKRRVLWARFSEICCCGHPPNRSCKTKYALFLLIKWLESIQFCKTNHVVIIYALWSLYLNETKDQRGGTEGRLYFVMISFRTDSDHWVSLRPDSVTLLLMQLI